MTSADGLVGATCDDGRLLVTTPNDTYVPDIVEGTVEVRMRKDFRYGVHDPLQWPQPYTRRFAYLAAVPIRIDPPHPHSTMWIPARRSDFVPLTGTPIKGLGTLRDEYLSRLSALVGEMSLRAGRHLSLYWMDFDPSYPSREELVWHELAMRQALARLRTMPAPFSEQALQVAELQRHWICADAYLRFHALVSESKLLGLCRAPPVQATVGAWTCERDVVGRLGAAGLPVWYVRSLASVDPETTRLRQVVKCRAPTDLCHELIDDPRDPVVYHGEVGEQHLAAMLNSGHNYQDIAQNAVARTFQASKGWSAKRYAELEIHAANLHPLAATPANWVMPELNISRYRFRPASVPGHSSRKQKPCAWLPVPLRCSLPLTDVFFCWQTMSRRAKDSRLAILLKFWGETGSPK